jgi:hypothetical protein
MQKLLLSLFMSAFSLTLVAQDFPYASFKTEEIKMTKYAKDTSAHAVVLAEFGKARISSDQDDLPLIFEYHVKIKILDTKGLGQANIELPFYIGDKSNPEFIYDLKGISYYQDEKGVEHKNELEKSKIFRVNENKYWDQMKFTMPDVHPGSIIEYSYALSSPYRQNFRQWVFQTDIPKMHSEYQANIPAIYNYNASLRGHLKLTNTKTVLSRNCFAVFGVSCDCSNITYVMDDVPAFVEEDFMTSPKNFISAINFELSDYTDLSTGSKKKVSLEWTDVDNALKRDDNFGSYLRRKNMLKDQVAPVIANLIDPLDKAKAIYAYIQKNIKWNNFNSIYTSGIRQALDKHTGTVTDINMALAVALTSAGLNAEVVLLSTRSNGTVNKLYPVLTEFNYLITKLNLGDKTYLLDATDPLLTFGLLPLRCLNDQGRVISMDKPSYWIDLNTEQRQSTVYTFDLTLQPNGKLKGTMACVSRGYSAFEKRAAIKNFNTLDEYIENLDERLTKIKILKSMVANVDSLEKPVSEVYEVEIEAYDNLNHQRLSFNPFIFNRVITNPFKMEERNYPVDWGMPSDTRYVLTMHLPDDYIIENPPQNDAFAIPQNGAKFFISYDSRGGSSFTFSHVTQFNKSVYYSNEYPYLKELYNKIILSEKTDIIFKKKI